MALQGSQKLAVLLCKFKDTKEIEPNPATFYTDLFAKRDTGGLNDYWIAASLGNIDLDGSKVFGWKVIDSTRADFLAAHPGRWDKIQGAIDAFPAGTTTAFTAVVALYNVDVTDGGAQGGVLGGPQDANVTFLGHESGHIFGLEHSFDHSNRQAVSWSQVGEYYDGHDIMSAMNVDNDSGHRFSPRGPLLNVANLDRMGWLPAARVWHPTSSNSSSYFEVDIVALEHPELPGFLAARAGGVWAEFRIGDGFDSGIARPAVLLHEPADPNSYIIGTDVLNVVHEWLPGQIFGPSPLVFAVNGGTRISIISFDLQARTARVGIQMKARRVIVEGPGSFLGGRPDAGGGGILILPNGKIVRIPPRSPILQLAEELALRELIETGGFAERPMVEFQAQVEGQLRRSTIGERPQCRTVFKQ